MLFKNILVPYDGSPCSNHAFKVALDLAKNYNSKITTLSCLNSDVVYTWYGFDSRVTKDILKKQKKSIEKEITKFTDLLKKIKIPFSSKIIETNSIAKSIVSFSKSNKIDLIVMGSHGRSGFDKILLGSVANGVSQQAKCPVLIIK